MRHQTLRERLGRGCDVVAGSRAIVAIVDRRLGYDSTTTATIASWMADRCSE